MKKIRMIIDLDVALHGTAKRIKTDPDYRWVELLGQVRGLKALLDSKTSYSQELLGRVAELESLLGQRDQRIEQLEKRMGI